MQNRNMLLYILCCGLFHTKSNITTNFSTCHELYVCSEVVKVEISTCGFQRRKKIKRKPLGSLLKLVWDAVSFSTPCIHCF